MIKKGNKEVFNSSKVLISIVEKRQGNSESKRSHGEDGRMIGLGEGRSHLRIKYEVVNIHFILGGWNSA